MSNISITIFGGTGDLTYRKLMPAIYNLFSRNLLNDDFIVCAIGRRDYSLQEYISIIDSWIKEFARVTVDEEHLKAFYKHINYFKMDFTNLDEYKNLNEFYQSSSYDNNLVYYAVAPTFFEIITDGMVEVHNLKNPKIILEKPFGVSLADAGFLSDKLVKNFGSENIYRIDHYLGKEMVRNILTIRETNPLIEKVWSKENIDNIEISALETVGVETRGNYYDDAGALKDMVQNHLLQILTIVALDNPDGNLADEQLRVLKALRPVELLDIHNSVVLGQYEGYREEEKVNPQSDTETFAGLKLFVDNHRWENVPFFIRTGKKTGTREIEVIVTFKKIREDVNPNVLIIKIQPVEGVYLEFNIKTPGEDGISTAKMEFCQNCNLIFKLNTPEAYERMILACIDNDSSWFSKWEQIAISWKYIQDLKDLYIENNLRVYPYKAGSDGPAEYENIKKGSVSIK